MKFEESKPLPQKLWIIRSPLCQITPFDFDWKLINLHQLSIKTWSVFQDVLNVLFINKLKLNGEANPRLIPTHKKVVCVFYRFYHALCSGNPWFFS